MADTKDQVHMQGTLNESQEERLAALCKALSHPVRVRLVNWLLKEGGDNGWVCNQLVKRLPLAQSTVSEHLRILRESGLLTREIHGQSSRYQVNQEVFKEFKLLLTML